MLLGRTRLLQPVTYSVPPTHIFEIWFGLNSPRVGSDFHDPKVNPLDTLANAESPGDFGAPCCEVLAPCRQLLIAEVAVQQVVWPALE